MKQSRISDRSGRGPMDNSRNMDELDDLLRLALQDGASDVHLKAGIVPVMRKHGKLRPIRKDLLPLSGDFIEGVAQKLMTPDQYKEYLSRKEFDLGYGVKGLGRFRINIFRQRGTTRVVIRNIPFTVPQLQKLHLPAVINKIAKYERGLVLVTGATGSGKSTTIAAIIDYINHTKNKHILTIEDPIEFLIRDRRSIITQRELGVDAKDFPSALRGALRQDPDVILIGEMRDRETIETALTAAETGHLVLSTLHTVDCQESINRILSVFEPHKQNQIRLQLGSVLRAIISQRLANKANGEGFVPAVEVMINNARIREMVEKPERTKDITSAIEEGFIGYGMQTFDQSLMYLVTNNLITIDEATRLTDNEQDFAVKFSGINKNDNVGDWQKNKDYQKKVANAWENVSELEIDQHAVDNDPPEHKKKDEDDDE